MSGLRDNHTQLTDASAQVLGVSLDSLETQTRFAESLKLPFPLLSDKGGVAARAYGVTAAGVPVAGGPQTFACDPIASLSRPAIR